MSREREGLRRSNRRRTTSRPNNDLNDSDDDDKDYDPYDDDSHDSDDYDPYDDDSDDSDDNDERAPTMDTPNADILKELAQFRAKEARRRALDRAASARYRARHPERIAAQKRRYRARHPEREAARKQRYRARHPERITAQNQRYRGTHAKRVDAQKQRYRERNWERCKAYAKQYYKDHAERLREQKRQFYHSEAGQRWQKQYRARKTERAALLRRQRGSMSKKRTEEKRHALGPLTLTVALEDFMQDFYDTLSPHPEDCMDQPETITDYSVDNESSLSSCDMWDGGKGFLDNLLEDLPSTSDDSLYEVLRDLGPWSPQESDFEPDFDLEDFV